jgi:hypothetical protein
MAKRTRKHPKPKAKSKSITVRSVKLEGFSPGPTDPYITACRLVQELASVSKTGRPTGHPRDEYAMDKLYELGLIAVGKLNEETGEIHWSITPDGRTTLRSC